MRAVSQGFGAARGALAPPLWFWGAAGGRSGCDSEVNWGGSGMLVTPTPSTVGTLVAPKLFPAPGFWGGSWGGFAVGQEEKGMVGGRPPKVTRGWWGRDPARRQVLAAVSPSLPRWRGQA